MEKRTDTILLQHKNKKFNITISFDYDKIGIEFNTLKYDILNKKLDIQIGNFNVYMMDYSYLEFLRSKVRMKDYGKIISLYYMMYYEKDEDIEYIRENIQGLCKEIYLTKKGDKYNWLEVEDIKDLWQLFFNKDYLYLDFIFKSKTKDIEIINLQLKLDMSSIIKYGLNEDIHFYANNEVEQLSYRVKYYRLLKDLTNKEYKELWHLINTKKDIDIALYHYCYINKKDIKTNTYMWLKGFKELENSVYHIKTLYEIKGFDKKQCEVARKEKGKNYYDWKGLEVNGKGLLTYAKLNKEQIQRRVVNEAIIELGNSLDIKELNSEIAKYILLKKKYNLICELDENLVWVGYRLEQATEKDIRQK